jgi:hypothetical protein
VEEITLYEPSAAQEVKAAFMYTPRVNEELMLISCDSILKKALLCR